MTKEEKTEEPKNGKTEKQKDSTIKEEKKEKTKEIKAKKSATKEAPTSKNPKKADKKDKIKLSKAEKKHSKKYREVAVLVEKEKHYPVDEAIELIKKTSTTKFDSSVEIHVRLGLDSSKGDQQLRGTVVLPHGTGKTKKIAVICAPDKEKEALDGGADLVGDKIIADIEKGKLDFDILVATPDMMAQVGKLGKILGTKGLMPNPKAGTVTPEVGKAVKELKAGRVEFKVDKNAIVHQIIGKVSFDSAKISDNYNEFLGAIKHAKPSGAKGTYILSVSLATTMGPGIKLEL